MLFQHMFDKLVLKVLMWEVGITEMTLGYHNIILGVTFNSKERLRKSSRNKACP